MPYAASLGIRVEKASAALTTGSVEWSAERCTAGGVMHGGVIMSLADSVAAICAYLNLPDGAATTTIESKTNFLRALRSGALHASVQPLHAGRTVIVLQTELTDDDGRAIAHTIQTQAVLAAS
jgi:1,4-dihydroxy-2-naphthoyl-CoA hydrolase